METHFLKKSKEGTMGLTGQWCEYISPLSAPRKEKRLSGQWCEYISPLSRG